MAGEEWREKNGGRRMAGEEWREKNGGRYCQSVIARLRSYTLPDVLMSGFWMAGEWREKGVL
jgi:hypothetical protein